MTHFLQSRSQRIVAVFLVLAIAAAAASGLLLFGSPAEAGSPRAVMNQAVSDYNDDILFRHGVKAWHEKGYSGSYHDGSKTVRLKVGIIDRGFDGWRMSSLQGMLPTPADLDDDASTQVKTNCYIKNSNGSWESSDFEGCESPNYGDPISDNHGTSVAETIYAIAPEAEFYISNPPDGSAEREAIEWMEREGVIVINRPLHVSFEAPGDGNPYAGQSNTDIHNLRYIMRKRGSEVPFVNSAGNHGRVT